MSAAGGRSGVGGGRASGGGGGGREEEWQRLIRSVGAKRRAAKKWTNWSLRPPPSLRPYAPGGAYYRDLPPLPPLVHAGEGSSRAAAGVAEELSFARSDEEERAAVAEAVAASKAALAAGLEAERKQRAEAIAAVEAFKAREAEERAAKRAAEAAKRAADVVVIDYADE